MKTKQTFKIAFLFILGIFCQPIFAQNLIPNPGFELGAASGSGQTLEFTNWDITNGNALIDPTTTAGEPRSGTRAVKVISDGTQANSPNPWSMQLTSDPIPTTIGGTYVVKVYVKSLLDQTGSIGLSTNSKINSNQQYLASFPTTFNTWTQLTWNVVANSTTTEFVLNMGSVVNSYIIDDFEVTGPPPVNNAPIVVGPLNPSFEFGTADGTGSTAEFTDWSILNGDANISPTTEAAEVRTGARALKVVSLMGINAYDRQVRSSNIPTTIGTVYTVRVYAKKLLDAAGSMRLSTNAQGSNQQYLANRNIGLDWTLLTWNVTANSTTTNFVLDMGGSENTYFVDDMEVTSPAPAPVTCLVLNGGLENGTGDVFTSWDKFNNAGGLLQTTVAAEVRSGLRALKAVVAVNGQPYETQFASAPVALTVGVNYTFSFYVKGLTASGTTVRVSTGETSPQYSPDFNVTGDWSKITWTIRATNASTRFLLDLGKFANTYFIDDVCLEIVCDGSFTPPVAQLPIAAGKEKFLGNVWSAAQLPNSDKYFNQVTPENAGKWGSVETTDQVFNWTQLDASRAYAAANNFPFRFHVLFWGAQQPTWLKPLSNTEKLRNIHEWLSAIRDRYNQESGPFKKPEYIEVFNEVLNDPPNNLNNATPEFQFRANNTTDNASGDYLEALRSLNTELGTTPWAYDYVINAFKLARQYFGCDSKLMINEYGVENDVRTMTVYRQIVDALKADNLIDMVGIQTHSFSTQIYGNGNNETGFANRNAELSTRLNQLADAGIPIQVTELDIDGNVTISPAGERVTTGTQAEKDAFQLAEFERIFPIYWNHPSVVGVTMWGYRTGHWRSDQAAYLMDLCSGAPRPAMNYLNEVIRESMPPLSTFPDPICPINTFAGKIVYGSNATPLNGDNNPLYVKMSENGIVKHIAKVGPTGEFQMFKVIDGTYMFTLSTTFDNEINTPTLPLGLDYSVDGLNDGTTSINDGTPDGKLLVTIINGTVSIPMPVGRSQAPAYGISDIEFSLAGAPLPVDLLSFNAKQIGENVLLNWKTDNEKGFSHFEVQKSSNLKEFGMIEKVVETAQNFYSAIDKNPSEGTNYYRLKMVDLDGKSKFSNIISASFEKNGEYITVQNPAENGEILLNTNIKGAVFELLTTSGRLVKTSQTKVFDNNYIIKSADLQPGLYFLNIIGTNKKEVKKVLVK